MALPKEINYSLKPNSLPQGTETISVVSQPNNGNTFSASSIISFDLVSRSYLIPESMYLRYTLSFANGAAATTIRGTPFYTTFSRLECYSGGSTLESVTNYGQICNMLVNCRMNYAQKQGVAEAFKIYGSSSTGTLSDITSCDGFTAPLAAAQANSSLQMAGPLMCIFSSCDHLLPLKFVPGCRINLTVDSISNIFADNAPASITIQNVELCYDIVEFNSSVDEAVMNMADERGRIMLKSQSYVNAGQSLPNGANGSFELIYNYRLLSIKSLFAHFSGTTSKNTLYDSFDPTRGTLAGTGRLQFNIASKLFPNLPLDTARNRAGVLMELSQAFGPVHDLLTTNFAITPPEWNYKTDDTTTIIAPSKFYCGVNTESLSVNQVLLSGSSTMNSPISLRIDLSVPTTQALVVNVIANYDAIFEIDVVNKQLTVIN